MHALVALLRSSQPFTRMQRDSRGNAMRRCHSHFRAVQCGLAGENKQTDCDTHALLSCYVRQMIT